MQSKGMTAAMTLVITIVVLIVVALALITITTENVGRTGGSTSQQQNSSFCDICVKNKCGSLGVGKTVAAGACGAGCPSAVYTCP